MSPTVVTMVNVPDVRATADWYKTIGFAVPRSHEEDGQMLWALLTFGESEIMLNSGGKPSDAPRREFDLYINANGVDEFYSRFKDRVDVVEPPHDTFYGMREFIFRDFNRFWITFAEPLKK
jgi:uncharacterized glyoxalase superfamily protein PhnB